MFPGNCHKLIVIARPGACLSQGACCPGAAVKPVPVQHSVSRPVSAAGDWASLYCISQRVGGKSTSLKPVGKMQSLGSTLGSLQGGPGHTLKCRIFCFAGIAASCKSSAGELGTRVRRYSNDQCLGYCTSPAVFPCASNALGCLVQRAHLIVAPSV